LLFNSYQLRLFAKEWGIEINNSSPNYPVINLLAEKYVGIMKRIMKRCGEIENVLLNYRNTPLVNIGLSPADLIQNRILRTKLPIKNVLVKNMDINIKEKVIEN